MSDIADDLTTWINVWGGTAGQSDASGTMPARALAEIVRLRAEVAALRAQRGEANGAEPAGCPMPGACAGAARPVYAAWYSDDACSYESARDAFTGDPPGTRFTLSECATIDVAEWQLVPVTVAGQPCPCGRADGCADFLGVDCQADRCEAMRVQNLPEEWRKP